jgi:hypothetical protein
MRKAIQIILIAGVVASWMALAFLIIRQRHLLEAADPMRDTGLSFGLAFLAGVAPLGLLIATAIVTWILVKMKRGARYLPVDDAPAKEPNEHEVSQLAFKMRSLFKINEDEARARAIGFLILAYGWGSPPSGPKLDRTIKRELSKAFEWVSEEERIEFEASEALRVAEQEIFISGPSSVPRSGS